MRAISLWQPWATAVALGSKRVETRHWSTRYRGLLAIHAAKRMHKGELEHYGRLGHWRGAMRAGIGVKPLTVLPFGAIVATCVLVDVRPSDAMRVDLDMRRWPDGLADDAPYYEQCWSERDMGNFEPGRFGWVLEDIQPTRWPIPFRGAQGFFNVPDELLSKERA